MTYLDALRKLHDHLCHVKGEEERQKALAAEIEAAIIADNLETAARRVRARCVDLGCTTLEACVQLIKLEHEHRDLDRRFPIHA